MSRSHVSSMVGALVVFAFGCAEDPSSQDQDIEKDDFSHADAILQCQEAKQRGLEDALTHPEIGEVLVSWNKCMAEANDRVAPRLEESLEKIESDLEGQVLKRFKLQRGAAEALCPVIVDASPEPGGLVAGTFLTDCNAGLEEVLSKLIAGFGGLADEQNVLLNDGEMRDQFPECMAVYDAKTEAASSQPELADATFGLAACLEEGIIARATSDRGLVGLTISSFPERTEAEVRDAVIGELGDMFAAGAETCAVLTEAGIDGGSLLANTLAGSCRAEAAQHVFGYMTTIVGPMSGAAPEE